MFDFVRLQDDVHYALLNRDELLSVNVAQYRKLRLQSEVDLATLVLSPRNGRTGAGILVEMPQFDVPMPNLPGPAGDLVITCVVLEVPTINLVPTTGTQLSAEQIAQWVLDTLHGFRPFGSLGFCLYADQKAINPVSRYGGKGVLAYEVVFRLRLPRGQSTRCDLPSYSLSGSAVTLTNGANTSDADIYYTLDGSFPVKLPQAGIPSVKYTVPFAVTSGQYVRWAAYKTNYCFSEVGYKLVP